MAGVGQRATVDEDRATSGGEPSALRIDIDVFTTLSATAGDDRGETPTIVGWFDCWQPYTGGCNKLK